MKAMTLMGLLVVSGCCGGASDRTIRHEQILIDRSLSVPEERFARFAEKVVAQADTWAASAKTSSSFRLWWMPAGKAYTYPALDTTFVIGKLRPPVHSHRKRIRKSVRHGVGRVLASIPPTEKTPLLESIYYIGIGMPRGRGWRLTIYSDLLHDGETWSFPARLDGLTDDELIDQMKRICPPVDNPPSHITIISWPGMVGSGRTSVVIHERIVKVYEAFFADWAPGSQLEIGSIY